MEQDKQADAIKIAAVITAMPRWIGALLAAEGMAIPESWRWWWIWLSLALNAAMAVVEGLAFAYVFNAWRMQRDKAANKLLWLAILSALVFIVVLAPFIAAQVQQAPLAQILGSDWSLWLWSGAVAASTIVIVASVGYAQKRRTTSHSDRTATAQRPQATANDPQVRHVATCTVAGCDWAGRTSGYDTPQAAQNALNAHIGHAHGDAGAAQNGRRARDSVVAEEIER